MFSMIEKKKRNQLSEESNLKGYLSSSVWLSVVWVVSFLSAREDGQSVLSLENQKDNENR